jgi:periplasmic protein TonB
MSAHVDILDERERPLAPHLMGSLFLHTSLIALITGYSWWTTHGRIQIGDPNAMGGSIGITPVKALPLPRRAETENLVANDTKSNVPPPPTKVKEPAIKEEPQAVPLKSRLKMKRERQLQARMERYRPEPPRPNQVYSESGKAVSSPMLGGAQGQGGVGTGANIFGARLGWYAQMLTQALASKWGMEAARISGPSAQRATLAFDIQRDGTISRVRVLESSGNSEADYAAQRAVLSISPFRRLPEEFERNVATVEFWFQLQR